MRRASARTRSCAASTAPGATSEAPEALVACLLLRPVLEEELEPGVARLVLQLRGALHPDPLVARERRVEVVAGGGDARAEDVGVLDGLRGTLRLERLHRVGGV